MTPYPKYKPSGIEWIGDIPEKWSIKRIKGLTDGSRGSFIDGDWIESPQITDSGIRYITTGNIGSGYYKEQGSSFITEETFNSFNCTELFPGDLIISRLFSPVGRSCILPDLGSKVITSVDNVLIRPTDLYEKRYLNYYFNSLRYNEYCDLLARGTTLNRISRSILGNNPVLVPLLNEQINIANFLDEKTSQIDLLISNKQKLIGLLKEEKTAIINEAVTKGISKKAKLKPSGMEWLGDVPEHWEVRKVGRSFNSIGSGTTPKAGNDEYYQGGTINWINTGDLNDDYLYCCEKKITQRAFNEFSTLKIYPVDTLLIALYGATIGKVAITKIEGCTNQACCAIAESDYFLTRFVYYWFIANRPNIINLSYGGGQPNISQEIIKFLKIPCPPQIEQGLIVSFLDKKTTQIEHTIARVEKEIELMQEYRTALISEVVTGKVKVS